MKCEVQPGLCHSMKTDSLQRSVDERLEPADHSKVFTSTCQGELYHIHYVCDQAEQQNIIYTNIFLFPSIKFSVVKMGHGQHEEMGLRV